MNTRKFGHQRRAGAVVISALASALVAGASVASASAAKALVAEPPAARALVAESALMAVDPVKSALVAIGDHGGFLGLGKHQHALLATRWHVALRIDRKNLSASHIEVAVPIASVEIDTTEARRIAGVSPSLPRHSTPTGLQGLAVVRELRFSSEKITFPRRKTEETIELAGPEEFVLTGTLTVHGPSLNAKEIVPITIPGTVEPAENGTFRFRGEFKISQTRLKIQALPKDEVTIRFDVQTQVETVVASGAFLQL
ncbi:MAG: YceI family protein [Oligoflexia bacterium]|nr:YceI family protein [Oligoflexia bacterium]